MRASHYFSSHYYDTLVKPFIKYDEYLATLAPEVEPMGLFAYRNSCIQEAWKNATPAVREKVMEIKKISEMSLEELGEESDDNEGKQNVFNFAHCNGTLT
jgi:hypothetical protein